MFTAVVRITGTGRIEDFRERLRWLMVRDIDAEEYTEHHAGGVLEYRFAPKVGIPFPAFTAASAEFPELTVEAEWERDGLRGRARIENGRLVEQASAEPQAPGIEVEVAEDARLVLALVCAEDGHGGCAGYAASAERHTYFRFADGRLELVDTEAADAALEALAFDFIDEWVWFDESTGPRAELERTHYARYGHPVRGANLRAEKLARLRGGGGRYSMLGEPARRAALALREQWLTRA